MVKKNHKENIHIGALAIVILFFVPFAFALASMGNNTDNNLICYTIIFIEIISMIVSLITIN